jgi:hypothetical protein
LGSGAAGLLGSSPNHPRTTEVDMSSVQASSESFSDGHPDAVAPPYMFSEQTGELPT